MFRLASVTALAVLGSTANAQHHHHDVIEIEHLGVYPGYEGHHIEGGATLYFEEEGHVVIAYRLEGVEEACREPNASAANSCGIHIHAGTSCANATAPAGHYYNASKFESDPWAHVVYDVHRHGFTNASFGYNKEETEGHTFVVHNHAGARVTCTVIPHHE